MKYKDENGVWRSISVKVADTLPIGAEVLFAGTVAPSGWFFEDGSEKSRTKYKELFDVIGTRFGEGDSSTTFNLPDRRGTVPVGLDPNDEDFNVLGKTGGEKEHTLTMFELPNTVWQNHTDLQEGGIKALFDNGSNYGIGSNGNNFNKPFSIVQPYLVSNYIIKAKQNVVSVNTDTSVNNSTNIIDITQSQNGRYITSKIPFNTEGILFFIFQAVGNWTNHVCQIAFFDRTNKNITIIGNWEDSNNTFLYNSIFEIVNGNQIRVKKYSQGNDITLNNFTNATDSNYGAIRPNKIYAVTTRKDLLNELQKNMKGN